MVHSMGACVIVIVRKHMLEKVHCESSYSYTYPAQWAVPMRHGPLMINHFIETIGMQNMATLELLQILLT
jgi:hypothetical protein